MTYFAGASREAHAVAIQADGKIVAVGAEPHHRQLRTRSLQPRRLARDSRDATDRLRRARRRERRGDPRRTARSSRLASVVRSAPATSPSPATTPTGSWTRASRATASRRPTSGATTRRAVWRCNQPQVVVAGVAADAEGSSDFALARYNSDGSLDTTFSADGKQTTDFGNSDSAAAVTLQGDGKIVAAGQGDGTDGKNFALVRYNPDGSLDTSFSGDGKQRTTSAGSGTRRAGWRFRPDGKIVAVGLAGGFGSGTGDFALARYNPNGSLDTSFSGDGRQTTDFGLHRTTPRARWRSSRTARSSRLARPVEMESTSPSPATTPTGRWTRASRATASRRPTSASRASTPRRTWRSHANGKLVVAGFASGGPTEGDFALARYNPNGTLDTSFSDDGKRRTDFGFGDFDEALGVALPGNGKIVVVGQAGGGATSATSASPATTTTARWTRPFPATVSRGSNFGSFDQANALALQLDGSIVAAGAGGNGGADNDFALARYTPDGSPDTSFSGDGKQRTDFGGFDGASGVALQPRRQDRRCRVRCAGRLRPSSLQHGRLARQRPSPEVAA